LVVATPCPAIRAELGEGGSSYYYTIGEKMVRFLASKEGSRLGGGECAHLASEALRVSGGEFIRSDIGPDSPGANDYVWGTRKKTISWLSGRWNDSSPTTTLQVGDVMQYRATTIDGARVEANHTSVIAALNSNKTLPTKVYEQNIGGYRKVALKSIDLKKLTRGSVYIYRPWARANPSNVYKFSVTNRLASSTSFKVKVGTFTSSLDLTGDNTASSFTTRKHTSSSSVPKIVLSNGVSMTVQTAGGYEIYRTSSGASSIRKLSP